eukprot:3947918-Pleurochrysis_carterae.AAC.1
MSLARAHSGAFVQLGCKLEPLAWEMARLGHRGTDSLLKPSMARSQQHDFASCHCKHTSLELCHATQVCSDSNAYFKESSARCVDCGNISARSCIE